MSRTLWLVAAIALLIWVAVILWPLLALLSQPGEAWPAGDDSLHVPFDILLTSLGWAVAVAVLSTLLGWAPGRVLGSALRSGRGPFTAAIILLPVCVPSYVIFYAWWQSWPPDSALFHWIESLGSGGVVAARRATLFLSLVCWTWPLVALGVALGASSLNARIRDLHQLDGPSTITRLYHAFVEDRRGLALGLLVAFLAALNNTTCFDLAEVFTYANELRAIEALGAPPRVLLSVAWPLIALLGVGAALVWLLVARRERSPMRPPAPSASARLALALTWLITFILPVNVFTFHLLASPNAARTIADFAGLYSRSAFTSLWLAAWSATIALLVTAGFAAAWLSRSRVLRMAAACAALTWIIVGLLPAPLIASALQTAYNRGPLTNLVYTQPLVLNLGHLAAFGLLAVVFGRWLARAEPPRIRDLRTLDDPHTLRSFLTTNRPRILAAAVAAFMLTFVFSLGEVAVTARLTPPMPAGTAPLAGTLLNDMHYQRPQSVLLAVLALIILGFVASLIITASWRAFASRARSVITTSLGIALLAPLLCACDTSDSPTPAAFKPVRIFGSPGTSPGQFSYPRCIALDHANRWVYVVDKTARVQKLSLEGEPLLAWPMPEHDNGKPTGISVGPDGRVYVPDTHYYRVIVFDPNGKELLRFGSYGNGPGQFTYPTDVAIGSQDRIYVSEYGGNDRIQVFSPAGEFLFAFGSFGPDAGQFNRPQSIAFNAERTELFIADACNHRIVVTDPDGRVLRTFGSIGREPGQVCYPYGLVMESNDVLAVAEFGNNRVQRFNARTGASLGIYGTYGREPGLLQYPWGVEHHDGRLFILDSGNNRVQILGE